MTPEAYEAIKDQLRYELGAQYGSHAKRNRGLAKRRYLGWVVKQDEIVMPHLVRMCQDECADVTAADIATVAQSTLDKWDGKGDWLAEAMAMQAEYADDRDTTASLLGGNHENR